MAGALLAGGCSLDGVGARRAAQSKAEAVVAVRSGLLYPLREALSAAWSATGEPFGLAFTVMKGISRYPGFPGGIDGDIIDVTDARVPPSIPQHLISLRSYLSTMNVDLAAMPSGALAPFRNWAEEIVALPLVLSEVQFYVHAQRLGALGISVPAAWSWSAMLDTAAQAQKVRPARLIGGLGWGDDANIFGALIAGLGGTFIGPRGAIDLVAGAAAALAEVANGARLLGWPPTTDILLDSPSGPGADCLFYLAPPVSAVAFTGSCDMCALIPMAFPSLPVGNFIPAWTASGLGITSDSHDPEKAAMFLSWLFEAPQQSLLASQGVPPIVLDPSVQKTWAAVRQQHPRWSRFEATGYFDLSAHLPPLLPPVAATLSAYLDASTTPVCDRVWSGTGVASALQSLQAGWVGQAAAGREAVAKFRSSQG